MTMLIIISARVNLNFDLFILTKSSVTKLIVKPRFNL